MGRKRTRERQHLFLYFAELKAICVTHGEFDIREDASNLGTILKIAEDFF